jgi:hypothetical protein
VDQIAAIVIGHNGFNPHDQETVLIVRQPSMMAMYRFSMEVRSSKSGEELPGCGAWRNTVIDVIA